MSQLSFTTKKKKMLKIFQKKNELAKYLGIENDRNKISRMIGKGEIVRWEGGEYMLAKDIVAEALIILQIQPKTVEDRSEEIGKLRKQLEETREDLETLNNSYSKLEEENDKRGEFIDDLISKGIVQRGC